MSKVVRLTSREEQQEQANKDALVAFAKSLVEMAEKGEIKSIIMAAKGSENLAGTVVTGWYGLDINERQELIAHLQMDVVKSFIEANYITP